MRYLPILIALAACADSTDTASDAEAETAPDQPLGKADAATFTGLYATSSTTLRAGDVPNVELLADGSYLRRRCYHDGCALPVAETDHFDTYTSSAGKTYIRFYSFRTQWNAAHDTRTQVPLVADVYEIVKTTTTIQLRKSYTTRWLTLRKTSAATLCSHGGGTWSADCACPGAGGWSDSGYIGFVAGLGGCTTIPGASESECDGTGGYYADDDATLAGTFCLCEHGMYLSNDGCAAL